MFTYYGSMDGGEPIVQTFVVKAANTITAGMMCSMDSGEIKVSATNDAGFVGVAVSGAAAGEKVKVIINPGAIYSVADANIRAAGATLDVATGALGVAASSNADFVVTAPSSASQPTLVVIKSGEHYLR